MYTMFIMNINPKLNQQRSVVAEEAGTFVKFKQISFNGGLPWSMVVYNFIFKKR